MFVVFVLKKLSVGMIPDKLYLMNGNVPEVLSLNFRSFPMINIFLR